ncbi:MAG: M48 family metalloprotease [Chitinivibrionales bacterium]|nr:M48 family metalloprotease [Chitinivibrionales bacterium]MBD3356309.1 M48 family metalloprotease [Chitinivibrionales bacterium]
MKAVHFTIPFVCAFLLMCQPVPLTQRSQLNLIPESQLLPLSSDEYQSMLNEMEVVTGTREAAMVKRVGRRIKSAVADYMAEIGYEERLEDYEWEFNLIEDSAINAFAMPGGKVGVFTGMMPVAETETGLAVVMAHEIAHVIAQHGNERMSQALLVQLGGAALSVALAERPAETRRLFLAAYGLGSQLGVLLPYSRLHESEADRLGLIFMAKAGYNPREAVDFWQRMEEASEGGAPPAFLSTHPTHQQRIENLREQMPEALEYYREATEAPPTD